VNADAIPNARFPVKHDAGQMLAIQLRALRIDVVPEFRFHDERRWRFDYAIPEKKIAVEIEGGAWTNGRHTRGAGFVADLEKYEEAMRLGWCVYRCTPEMVRSGRAMQTIEILLAQRC
jgi:very-short-patch-repair endonuclease